MSRNQLDISPITDKTAMSNIEALNSDKQLNEFSQVTYEQLILRTSEYVNIKSEIIEKDYFVTVFLKKACKENT